MKRVSNEETAVQRAHWLAELADALDAARHLVKEYEGDGRLEALELHARIEAARFEVQTLRLRRSPAAPEEFDPKWTQDAPWKLSA